MSAAGESVSFLCLCVVSGQCVREFPVFGILEGVCVMGVIDELSYNQKGELVLNELKTRRQDSLPGAAQTLCNCFQVCDLMRMCLKLVYSITKCA